MNQFYYSFNNYLKKRFNGKVRRISLNAGLGCPHKDKSLGLEGCFYCNEEGFAHQGMDGALPLSNQIENAIKIFKKQFKADKFIAYFQNASNTYARIDDLKKIYDEVSQFKQIVGISISTRPDCIDKQKLELIDSYCDDYEVWIEYGLQSIHNKSLRMLNRQHDAEDFIKAVKLTAKTRIKSAAHVILGIPSETRQDMVSTADALAGLPVDAVKIHIFHILKNTVFAKLYEKEKFDIITETEYINAVCDFLEHIPKQCLIMRLVSEASPELLIAPQWMNNKHRLLRDIESEFKKRNTFQGYHRKDKE